MMCKQCASANQRAFNGELAVHFPGLEGLERPIVWVFPKLLVCLHGGFTEFPVPKRELSVLVHDVPVEGAVISPRSDGIAAASKTWDESLSQRIDR